MKKILFLLMLSFQSIYAQDFEVKTSSVAYQNLAPTRTILSAQKWNKGTHYDIKMPIDFNFNGEIVDSLFIYPGLMYIYIEKVGVSTFFQTDVVDKSLNDNISLSNVSYMVDGLVGSRKFTIEFNDFGIEDGFQDEKINVQFVFSEQDNSISTHFGDCFVLDYIEEGPIVCMLGGFSNYSTFSLSGNYLLPTIIRHNSSPENYNLDSLPPINTMYQFIPSSTAIGNKFAENLNVYPNPTNGFIEIKGAEFIRASVYNSLGKNVLNLNFINNTLDISELETGFYFINVYNKKDEVKSFKMQKN